MTTKVWTSDKASDWERMLYDQLASLEWPSKQLVHFDLGCQLNRNLFSKPEPKSKDTRKGAVK
jgi:hypothetical protein